MNRERVSGTILLLLLIYTFMAFGVSSATVSMFDEVTHTSEYVIITTNDIVANSDKLEIFIRLKEAFGYSVRVVTEKDFNKLTGQAPNGRAEKIRQWLIDNQAPLGIRYALLIGNPDPDDPNDPSDPVGEIPMKMCWPRFCSAKYRESPTDFFYADLDGDWDLDSDCYFGEYTPVNNLPDLLSDGDTFSIRWTGQLDVEYSERYGFRTFSDDGVRLWIDGNLIIDEWASHPPMIHDAFMDLSAGKHTIEVHYYENTGDAIMELYWKSEHQTQNNYWIIPSSHLFHDGNTGGLYGEYYENMNFSGVPTTRIDGAIDFAWVTGDNGLGGVDFTAEIYVGRIPVYDNDYTQLDHILEKMINYTKAQGDLGWRKKILLPAYPYGPLNPGWDLGDAIKEDIADPNGFTSFRIYNSSDRALPDEYELMPCTVENVENEWKKGYGMTVWFTHGGQESASRIFSTSRCQNLDDTKPSFTFQTSCSNAWPENKDNLAYSLLKHGAVSTVGATRAAWGWSQVLPYNYTKNLIQDQNVAGEALFRAKTLSAREASWSDWCNVLVYNLYGDPACSLFPSFTARFKYNPEKPVATDIITFNASESYSQKGNITSYSWDFGDGNITKTTHPVIDHTYKLPGKYAVALRVTDNTMRNTTTTIIVTVYFGTDLNKDVRVNITDLFIVSEAFGTKEGDETYNPIADLDRNKEVNMVDLYEVAKDYGKTLSSTSQE